MTPFDPKELFPVIAEKTNVSEQAVSDILHLYYKQCFFKFFFFIFIRFYFLFYMFMLSSFNFIIVYAFKF